MMPMIKPTLITAMLLILIGVGGYLLASPAPGTDSVSPTALIPAIFGVLLGIAGLLARKAALYKHAMHGAVIIGLLGLIGTAMRLPKTFGGEEVNAIAATSQVAMVVILLVYVVLCVKSFIDARKARQAGS